MGAESKEIGSATSLAEVVDPSAARTSTLKRVNMRRFLEELRRRGPSTRADLMRATGVAAPTSSSIIADLVATGFLEESDSLVAGKGRPGKLFRLTAERAFVIGITLGPQACAVAPAGLNGSIARSGTASFTTPDSYTALIDRISAQVEELRRTRTGRCLGVGISLPGLIDERAGTVAMSPNLHLTDGRPIGPDLAERLETGVLCIQEEHALCLAEQSHGQARGLSNFAVLDITYGMGMGVVSGGRYVSGRDGFAGEIGHVTVEPEGALCGCGNRGCFETVATDLTFLNSIRDRLGPHVGFEELTAMIEEVDVRPEIERTLAYLALAVAAIVNVFNPDAVLVSSRLFDLSPDALTRLVSLTSARVLAPSRKVAILPATANRMEGVLAGLLDHVFARVGPKLA